MGLVNQDEDYSSAEDYLKVTKKRRASYIQEPRDFSCTACGMLLKKRDVLRHPQLEVCICRKCKNFLFSGPFHKVHVTFFCCQFCPSDDCQVVSTCDGLLKHNNHSLEPISFKRDF